MCVYIYVNSINILFYTLSMLKRETAYIITINEMQSRSDNICLQIRKFLEKKFLSLFCEKTLAKFNVINVMANTCI